MKIYIICPVRNMTKKQSAEVNEHVKFLEKERHKVHFPPRDVDQTDDGIGLSICQEHARAMKQCDRVAVYWDEKSKGSHFDLGMAFILNKPVYLINNPERTKEKSYTNVLRSIAKW